MTDVAHTPSLPGAVRTTQTQHAPKSRLILIVAVIGGLILLIALFGRIMDFGIRRDEMLFVAPAHLLGRFDLYTDFFYNHLPYSAWLFRGSYLAFGDLGLLMSARLAVFAGWLLLLGAAMWGVYVVSRAPMLAIFTGVALITNETLLGQAGMAASNNLLPLSFGVLALGLFLNEALRGPVRAAPLFCAGLCLSIATGMKISAVVIIPPLVIGAFLLPRTLGFVQRLRRVVLPALIGGLLGAAPLFLQLLSAPEVFMAHVTGFHTGPHIAYWEAFRHTEPELAMSLRDKVVMAYAGWLSGGALLLTLGVVASGWLVLTGARERAKGIEWGALLLTLAVLGTTMVMSLVPTPAFPQYYAAPVVFLPFVGAVLVRALDPQTMRALVPALAAGMILMVFLALPRLGPGLLALRAPAQTEVAQFDAGGREIASVLSEAGLTGPIATLMPLYPLEEGLEVYPEIATGQFAYRVADFITPDLAGHFVMSGPDGMAALFEATPPAALLLGYEPDLEGPMRAYAQAHGYQPAAAQSLSNRYGDGVLFIARGEVAK
ncbi:hypothetical protein [uncultured Tateyamaria sp.]|uniref:hypothetical protein n=1 Tax=uncultured Tateyamaria sp. TaxID=455651 RepID=UPI002605680C|nr:hypothetical protein [uncultured Tateyamaria sp.]